MHPTTSGRTTAIEASSFFYKDGFYKLPYLVNSPQGMIESFKKIPFVHIDQEAQSISAKTPALNVTVYHREIEEGLFLIYSTVAFKANVCFEASQDTSKSSDYYCLSLRIDHYSKINNSLAGGTGYTDNSWLIFKPGAKVDHYHFKGTNGQYFSLYFSRQWIKAYLRQISSKDRRLLNLFLGSANDHLICPNFSGDTVYDKEILSQIMLSGKAKDKGSKLKKEIFRSLSFFISKMRSENINEGHFSIPNLERIKVLKAERIFKKHLHEKFPGIALMAREVGLSETKLKECFKRVYGKTIFQYFRDAQMEEARKLISNTGVEIREIAHKFGYKNAGKFAAAFKACHGVSPSSERVRKNSF